MRHLIFIFLIVNSICFTAKGQITPTSEYHTSNNIILTVNELSLLTFSYERYISLSSKFELTSRLGLGVKASESLFDNSGGHTTFTQGIGIMTGWSGHHAEFGINGAYDIDNENYAFSPSLAYRYYFKSGFNTKVSLSYPINDSDSITKLAGGYIGVGVGYSFR